MRGPVFSSKPPVFSAFSPGGRIFRHQWIGPLLLLVAFLGLTAWSWRRWADLTIDFGRELYIPWQLTAGQVLYRDLAYFNGPLSPYLNALWFRLFGVSFTTLIIANLIIILVMTWLMFRIIKELSDELTAVVAGLVFLCAFAFAHYECLGDYNYVCPYSHDLTHGLALILAVLWVIVRGRAGSHRVMAFLAGFFLGLVFLTKGEVFLAAAAATGVGISLVLLSRQKSLGGFLQTFLILGLAMLIPIAGFFLYLSSQMPAGQALKGVAGTWSALWSSDVTHNFFYRRNMGLDRLGANSLKILREFLGLLLFAGAAAAFGLAFQSGRKKLLFLVSGTAMLAGSWWVRQLPPPPWLLEGWPLPLLTVSILIVVTAACFRKWNEPQSLNDLAPLAFCATLAFILLLKNFFRPSLSQYGFVLAMPAVILLVITLIYLVPKALQAHGGSGTIFRGLIMVTLLVDLCVLLTLSNYFYSRKDYLVGTGNDAIFTYDPWIRGRVEISYLLPYLPRGEAVNQLLQEIKTRIAPGGNFVVLPEGVMVNFLTRRRNPTPYVNFMPPELAIFGEGAILEALQAHPPDYVILIHKNTAEYGVKFFGADPSYGKLIMDWVASHYRPVWQTQHEPLQDANFGIKLMKRRGRFS